ncbi:elongation of very long chain fatty acids protein F-like [Teleopsis dalmanni]|uniref:elongation of very long chain fatty acids protein F-like n=1 Tax=Teleopsis dalmanni TaxID=139649 RepID=UPI0018CCAB9A|nr:elongation of very long chain fatty acids protein F-like [Teleopsis dalmanni]
MYIQHLNKRSRIVGEDNKDEIFSDIFINKSPVPICLISIAYLLFVLKIGPAFMRKRSPFNVRKLVIAYNILQILLNGLTVIVAGYIQMKKPYDWRCIRPLPMNHALKRMELYLMIGYYFLKVLDFADTIFFVLRKSFRQISFLHVYHHAIMVISGWLYVAKYGEMSQILFVAILNAFYMT